MVAVNVLKTTHDVDEGVGSHLREMQGLGCGVGLPATSATPFHSNGIGVFRQAVCHARCLLILWDLDFEAECVLHRGV